MTNSKTKNKKVLIIAGIDPTGHAGIFRDVAVCQSCDVAYIAFPTALAAQTDQTYLATQAMPVHILTLQWQNLDFQNIAVIKIGMIPNLAIATFLTKNLKKIKTKYRKIKIIWDPVLHSTSGGRLISQMGFRHARQHLLPLVSLITPNAVEACRFLGIHFSANADGKKLAGDFYDQFHIPIYLKGGHLTTRSNDFLVDGENFYALTSKPSGNQMRGTGCFFSTTVACQFMKTQNLGKACVIAKSRMTKLFWNSDARLVRTQSAESNVSFLPYRR